MSSHTGAHSAVNQHSFPIASVKMFQSCASLRCSLLESVYLPRSENNWIALRNVLSTVKLETSTAVSLHDGEYSAQNLCFYSMALFRSSVAACMYDKIGLYSNINQHLFSMAFARDRLAETL